MAIRSLDSKGPFLNQMVFEDDSSISSYAVAQHEKWSGNPCRDRFSDSCYLRDRA